MDEITSLDGSTIDAWMGCPYAARCYELGLETPTDEVVKVGEVIHDILSNVLSVYCQAPHSHNEYELRMMATEEMNRSRPDIQPEVVAAMTPSLYSWSRFIRSLHPENIWCFDGGETCNRSGQLSAHVDDTVMTSELDLLYAMNSDSVLYEVDYKTGQSHWDAERVAQSGQFQRHAVLVFENFSAVEELQVRVWNIRTNSLTHTVKFHRKKLDAYVGRVRSAINNRKTMFESPPTWPEPTRCSRCRASMHCPATLLELRDVASNPGSFVRHIAAVEAKLAAMKKLADSYVDANGTIVDGELRYGRDAPRDQRRQPAKLYTISNTENS